MGKKMKMKFLARAALAATLTFGTVLTVSTATKAFADSKPKYEWSGAEVEDAYAYGTTFTVPERSIGEEENIFHCLTFPDGSSTYADSVALTMGGAYTLTYTAKIDGKAYSETHTFVVENALYTTSNALSTIEYTTPSNLRPEGGQPSEKKGLVVGLAKDDVLTFNKAISVESLKKGSNFVEGFILPEVSGSTDFGKLWITLTDMENPDIYVKIAMTSRDVTDGVYGQTYVLAGGNGQDMVGLQVPHNTSTVQKVYKNEFGQTIYLPFDGKMSIPMPAPTPSYTYETYADDYPFRLSLDMESKEIWLSGNYVHPVGDSRYDQSLPSDKANTYVTNNRYDKIITDLDEAEYYNTVWNGFKSDYVKLSISADKYSSSLARFCVTSVMGMDLSKSDFEITEKPVITVNASSQLPEAKVGESYPIPLASAHDLYSGNVEVKTNVWYNYVDADGALAVKVVDGKFYPERLGYYAIVYTATNAVGLTTQEIVWVHASDTVPEITLNVSENKVTAAKMGQVVSYAETLVEGGSGDVTVRVYAKHRESGEIIATENGFRPEKAGVWEVVYEATDFIGQQTTVSYEVNVAVDEKPILVDTVVLPKAYVSGGKYQLPVVYGNRYAASGNGDVDRILCDVSVTASGATTVYKAGDTFSPTVANSGDKLVVQYLCDGTVLHEEEIVCIKPYSTDGNGDTVLDYAKYFLTDNAVGEKSSNEKIGYTLTANGEKGEISFLYANPLVAHTLETILHIPEKTANYEELTITFTDTADYDNAIEAVFKEINGKVCFVVGDNVYQTAYEWSVAAFDIPLTYANGAFTYSGVTYPVTSRVDGSPFEGFTSDKIYYSVKVKNAAEGSQIGVLALGGYRFTDQDKDKVAPYFVQNENLAGGVLGMEYRIPVISVFDVICPSVSTSLTVTAPDGSIVTDVNGVALKDCNPFVEYVINIEQVGNYTLQYTAVEDHNFGEDVVARKRSLSLFVGVLDTEAPVITLTSDYKTTATVGDTLVMADFTVSDNITEGKNIQLYVSVVNPHGMSQTLYRHDSTSKPNAIICSMAGVYTFRIMAIDELGNIAIEEMKVTVTEREKEEK